MSPRFVLISDHSAHGQLVAKILGERGIALEAVLWHRERPKSATSASLLSPTSKARRWLGFVRHHRNFYAFLQTRVLFVDGLDGEKARRILQRLAPDYILMASGHILKSPIIETAKSGVLNAHPALLPWVRGSGVVGHSLEQGVPVGATLHYIDAGIDTGQIIERRLLPIKSETNTLRELEDAAGVLAAHLMADVVAQIVASAQKPAGIAQTARFPLFRWPDAAGRGRLNDLATNGRAHQLFEAWKPLSEGEPYWKLPPEMMDAPLSEK